MKKNIYQYWVLNFSILILFILFFSSFSNSKTTAYTQEKIYIHFDKPNYYAGEDIWFKVYLVNAATHSSETISKVVYVDLINPKNEIIETKTIKINEGGGESDFKLSAGLAGGEYTVRAYTNFMRNFNHSYFFRKKVYIKSLRSENIEDKDLVSKSAEIVKPDIQFFPEGGYLVNGFFNRVGFKALRIDGKGIDIEGTIIDNSGKEVLQFKTSKFGLGKFEFIPEKNKLYKAIIVYKGVEITYKLPVALDKGVVMKVIEHSDDYRIYLKSSFDKRLNNFNFIGTQRKGVIFKAKLNGNNAKALIKVPKNILEQGIVQFTLFNNNNEPISERISFFETNKANVNINITPSKQEYGTRELVELEISLDTIIQQKLQTNMSIAVIDMSTVETDPNGLDIKSQLLLNSELKGTIEQPGYYLYSDDSERKRNLDLLMMTQGWRQFIINDTLNNQSKQTFSAETDISLSGSIKSFYNHNKSAIAEVSLTYNNSKELGYDKLITNNKGQFIFKNLNFLDTTSVIIQAKKIIKDKKSKNVKNPKMNFHIEIDSFIAPKVTLKQIQNSTEFSKEMINKSSENTEYLESIYQLQKGTVKLDEVVLKTYISIRDSLYNKKRVLYKDPSHTVAFEDIFVNPTDNPLTALEGRVPGVSWRGDGIYMRGASTMLGDNRALLLLDGMPVGGHAIESIPISDIAFIDVLKGYKAAIYGSRAANGVIAVYTHNGSERSKKTEKPKKRGIINFVHPGYSHARKFYEPVYRTQKKEDDKFDYRSTMYWNPTIKLNEQGKASISFYTDDVISPYRVILEGITQNGQIIKTEIFLNK